MACIENGMLQAYLDDELTRDEKKVVMQHLETCASCREELEELQALESEIEPSFQESDLHIDVDAAWRSFESKIQEKEMKNDSIVIQDSEKPQKQKGVFKLFKLTTKTKRFIASGVAAATIFGSLAFPQVQVAADQFLSMFRVNQVEMVKLTQEDMNEVDQWLSREEEGTYELKGLGEIGISDRTTDFNSYSEQSRFNRVQEAEEAGYDVPEIDSFTFESLNIDPGYTMSFNLDVTKANNLLTQFGVERQFDQALDGKTFSLQVGESRNFDFRREEKQVSYSKVDAPTFAVPKGTSVEELKDTLLELPFVPYNVKRQIQQIQSIEETLPLPYIEHEDEELEELNIAGNKGYLMNSDSGATIMWQEGEYIHIVDSYTVHGQNGVEKSRLTNQELKSIANDLAQ
ncbi:zf-HC2 domain-containing protein [Pontibacillus salipaludis]|uniref:zf-HC2 domain-containing protein n=1 Tax=Pontibacillus salipaludis TaxID=1697394 RepID=UPI0031EB3813